MCKFLSVKTHEICIHNNPGFLFVPVAVSSSLLSSALVIVPVCTSVFVSPTRSRWLKVLKETQIRTQQRAFDQYFPHMVAELCSFGIPTARVEDVQKVGEQPAVMQ